MQIEDIEVPKKVLQMVFEILGLYAPPDE